MILCMIIASILFIGFVFLFMTASNDIIDEILTCCKEIEIENQKNLQTEMKLLVASMKHEEDLKDKTKIKKGKALKKKLDTSKERYEVLRKGKISVFALQGKNPAPVTHIFVKKTGKDEFTPCIPMDTYGRIAWIE